MERIYDNPGFNRRQNISLVVLVAVIIYGFFELYTAFFSGTNTDSLASMFGILFVGGGIYGMKTMWDDSRDLVTALDVDFATGQMKVTLWRPMKPLVIEAPIESFRNWRHWVKIGKRNMRQHYLLVDAPSVANPLMIELVTDKPVADGIRRLAPDAVDEFETSSGVKRLAEAKDEPSP